VTHWPKPELLTYPAFDILKLWNKKLDGIATCRANHVMVRPTVQAELVARHTIVKIDLIGETALRQELESAINSRIADAGVALPHEPVQLLGAEMVARGEKHVEDTVAFRTLLKAFFAEMSRKDAQCLSGQVLATRSHVVHPLFW
jgi:hypothetical protein